MMRLDDHLEYNQVETWGMTDGQIIDKRYYVYRRDGSNKVLGVVDKCGSNWIASNAHCTCSWSAGTRMDAALLLDKHMR
jgi:hypothetical protein